MFKKVKYKSQLFLGFILLTLFLVGSLSLANYLNGRRLMTDAARLHTTDMLVQLKNTNDLLVQNMEQALRGSSSYAELELFAAQYPVMEGYQEKNAIFNRVADILKLNTYFTACYVYYPEQNMMIDVNSRTPSFSLVHQNKNGSLVTTIYEAYQEIEEKEKPFLCPVVRTSGDVEWFMAVPVQYSSWATQAPLLIVAIENSYFFQSLNTLVLPEEENSQVFICTPQGQWVGEQQPEKALIEKFDQEAGTTGDFIYSSQQGKQLVVYTESSLLGWRYLCVVPLSAVYSQVRFLAYVGLFAAGMCVAAGIALARLLAGRLYTPLELLSSRIKSKTTTAKQNTDAFNTLYEGVDELLNKNAQMQIKLKEREQIAKNAFLFRLLQDDIELYDSYYEQLASYRIPFKEDMRYLIAHIALEQGDTLHSQYEERQKQWEKVLEFDQTLKDAFSTLDGFHLETVSLDECTLAVVLGLDDPSFTQKEMVALLRALQQDAQERLECSVTLGFSRISSDISKLPELNRQAHAAVEQQFFLGSSCAIAFDDLPKEITEAYRYPWNTEKVILSGLRQGQLEQTHQAIDVFEKFVSSKIHDTKQSRAAFLHLCTDIVRIGEEIVPDPMDGFRQPDIHQKVLTCSNSAEIVKCLKEYSSELCEKINKKRGVHNNDIAQAAVDYLEKNYSKQQMDMEMLSRELGFSISYISKMFKASQGISIKEYLTQKRIEKACELLLETNMKVWEIGSNVGYEQQRSFLEIFKKYKGLTPSDYRKQGGGKEEDET